MTKDEALKLALEALEEAWYHVGTFQPTEKAIDLYDEARTAIKEALAQSEQEPVAWRDMAFARLGVVRDKMHPADVETVQRFLDGDYTAPPQRKPLSDEEIEAMWPLRPTDEIVAFARAIEAAHGIKGEA